ncbi:hypothetical protein CI102_9768 [Trichoderma harzianum]|nr:hypothetical protein CI102_9768 [Trichoderma harzianum]
MLVVSRFLLFIWQITLGPIRFGIQSCQQLNRISCQSTQVTACFGAIGPSRLASLLLGSSAASQDHKKPRGSVAQETRCHHHPFACTSRDSSRQSQRLAAWIVTGTQPADGKEHSAF